MSHKANDIWLDAAAEAFSYAIVKGEYEAAAEVAEDVRSHGLTSEASTLQKVLNGVRYETQEKALIG